VIELRERIAYFMKNGMIEAFFIGMAQDN